jgi:hypothetical protein
MSKRSFASALGNLLALGPLGRLMPAVAKISTLFEERTPRIRGARNFWGTRRVSRALA